MSNDSQQSVVPTSNPLAALRAWLQEQWMRIPAVPRADPGSYERGHQNGMADILRGVAAQLPSDETDSPRFDYDKLKGMIQADRAYAWSWQCNLCMPMFDGGMDIDTANEGAARIMEHLFGIDVRKFPEWESRRRPEKASEQRD